MRKPPQQAEAMAKCPQDGVDTQGSSWVEEGVFCSFVLFFKIGDNRVCNGKDLVERRQLMVKTELKWRREVLQ